MKFRSGNDIRETFLRFFESKTHRRVHSSSLVPANDPTLLFTNAGMNQFKDMYLGLEKRDYTSATTSQKCVRAGGKHNDLENVGFTRRHHTFFEMLGNFSFGDYFKREAIAYSWDLITNKDWFDIPKDRLYVTIFSGEDGVPRDDEAEKFWNEIGVTSDRIREYGLKDNFWQMGETGPCGPCSEIFYDLGIDAAETPGVDKPFGEDDSRYVEIWNLVFDQFDRSAVIDPATKKTVYTLNPLPNPCIDTGMGLERVAAVLQRKISNYETDLFVPLINAAARLVGFKDIPITVGGTGAINFPSLEEQKLFHERKRIESASLRIIADHARATTFLINDGVLPSNEGRGYVLRKIMRRAIRHGRQLGQNQPFLCKMVYAVRDLMGGAYPELHDSVDRIAKVVEAEEKQFTRVLSEGSRRFDLEIAELIRPDVKNFIEFMGPSTPLDGSSLYDDLKVFDSSNPGPSLARVVKALHYYSRVPINDRVPIIFPGQKAFHLYETFGLPEDFIADACRDAGVVFDQVGFNATREEEKARARASWKGGSQKTASPAYRDLAKTEFLGYTSLIAPSAKILAIVKDGVSQPAAAIGETVEIVLDQTSFYGDSGGQVGDTGFFLSPDGNTTVAEITGCVLPVQGVRAHKAVVKEALTVGDTVRTVVDEERRNAIRRNHTATHLLQAALRQVLGEHVKQAGSSVHPDRLRFDFSHFAQVAEEELAEIESIVNKEILANVKVNILEDVPIDQAVSEFHAMALFGEKYGDKVRVVQVTDGFSTELCGGTHASATGEIGLVKILNEGAVSSGVRRIEAISGFSSLETFRRDHELSRMVEQLVPSADDLTGGLRARLNTQEEELKKLRRELDEFRMKSAASSLDEALGKAVEVKGVKLVTLRADSLDRGQLRTLVDNLKQKLGEGVVVIGSAQPEGKVAIIVGVTPSLTKKIQAGKLVGAVAKLVGGSGGGKPEIAEAGGKDPSQIDAALAAAPGLAGELLK